MMDQLFAEIRVKERKRDLEQLIEERHSQLERMMAGRRIFSVRHVSGQTWEMLLEGGEMVSFEYEDVVMSEWRRLP